MRSPGDLLGRYCATARPQHSRGIFSRFAGIKRLNTPFQIWRSGLRSLSSRVSIGAIRFPDEKRCREHDDHGIAFQRIAWFGIFESAKKKRAQQDKKNK